MNTWLDLGSGPTPADGYTGVDYGVEAAPGSIVMHVNLWDGTPWPFDSGSIERLRAWHVIEHINHDRIRIGTGVAKVERRVPSGVPVIRHQEFPITQDAFFWFFDEAYRVAKPGCVFELAWPYPWHEHADQDPTHCRRVPESMLHYLSREGRNALRVNQYPMTCDWRITDVKRLGTDVALEPFSSPEVASRHVGAFHEIRATLVKG